MSPAPLHDRGPGSVSIPGSTIARLFSDQCARTPDATAVIFGNRQLSYRELDELSDRLAFKLQSLGVKPDTLVGVGLERSELLVTCILSVLKAGGAYVPLDPAYPEDRLAWMIEDSKMPVLLTTSTARFHLPTDRIGIPVIEVDTAGQFPGDGQHKDFEDDGSNLAYVIYTSGSTGRPKGVMVETRNVINFFNGMDLAIGSDPGVWLAVTSMCFDISVLELLWTLTRGFTVVIHSNDSGSSIADEIERNQITHLQMTPSLARMLTLDKRSLASLRPLRKILLGGEAVPPALVTRLRAVVTGEIYNMYGPTETTVWSTCHPVGDVQTTVPIGRPILNTQVYLLDSSLTEVPTGQVGELWIGGEGVARGYWNRPDATADKFRMLPVALQSLVYRTGDLGRCLPDGSLEFLGRVDYQIKLRGHRIEPGEIEYLLERCTGVRQAVVLIREGREGDQRLIAYVVPEGRDNPDVQVLNSRLRAKLPDFMIPTTYQFVPAFPLTDNGKIDRKALLKMPLLQDASRSVRPAFEAGDSLMRTVADIWADALGLPAVGLNENFFDLGAHSLTLAEVHGKLQEALGREIPLVDLFQFSTISSLVAHLGKSDSSVSDSSTRAELRRSRAGARTGS